MPPRMIELQLRLELETPLHVGTGYGLAGYLDARTMRDHRGRPFIPGSSLKGRLRFTLGRLSHPDAKEAVEPLFGKENQAGALFFGNLHLAREWANLFDRVERAAGALETQRRTSVMLSRLRGVALERRLFTVETVPPPLAFEGTIAGPLPDDRPTIAIDGADCPRDLAWLAAACRALTHLGGRKSRGLGRCRLLIPEGALTLDGARVEPDDLLLALEETL